MRSGGGGKAHALGAERGIENGVVGVHEHVAQEIHSGPAGSLQACHTQAAVAKPTRSEPRVASKTVW